MHTVGLHGGLGLQARLNSTDIYSDHGPGGGSSGFLPAIMRPRMCHTISVLNGLNSLLVGGRTSPDSPLADCWLRTGHEWRRVEDLPVPRYRHCATQLQSADGVFAVLVFGGKGPAGKVLDDWLLWEDQKGWKKLSVEGQRPGPLSGASMIGTCDVEGILIGGMTQDGLVRSSSFYWAVHGPGFNTIRCQPLSLDCRSRVDSDRYLDRFGASLVSSRGEIFLVGGIGGTSVLAQDEEILRIDLKRPQRISCSKIELITVGPRPLLVGCTVLNHGGNTYILGGGAVCFSFGAHQNEGLWVLEDPRSPIESPLRLMDKNVPSSTLTQAPFTLPVGDSSDSHYPRAISLVPRLSLEYAGDFQRVLNEGRPVILEGLQVGSCTQKWTPEYMKEQVGVDRQVNSHSDLLSYRDTKCNPGCCSLRLNRSYELPS